MTFIVFAGAGAGRRGAGPPTVLQEDQGAN